ncbi:hypothetical protein E4U54_004365 [Claviceps lovelessii]|nr:hypothetical protein E4U54_004365 [Claviceps lovelessii]
MPANDSSGVSSGSRDNAATQQCEMRRCDDAIMRPGGNAAMRLRKGSPQPRPWTPSAAARLDRYPGRSS